MTLHQRLSEATEGTRELDALVEIAVRHIEAARTGLDPEHWAKWTVSRDGWVEDPHTAYEPARHTQSLDAALALAERLGWTFWSAGQGTVNAWAHIYDRHPDQDGPTHNAKAATPALALCLAILKAKGASDE